MMGLYSCRPPLRHTMKTNEMTTKMMMGHEHKKDDKKHKNIMIDVKKETDGGDKRSHNMVNVATTATIVSHH